MRRDVELRRNGVLVQAIRCPEPIAQRPPPRYTDELIGVPELSIFYPDTLERSQPCVIIP
jgi:hypothetical protein